MKEKKAVKRENQLLVELTPENNKKLAEFKKETKISKKDLINELIAAI